MLAPSRGDEQLSAGLTLPSPTCADASTAATAADRGRTLCGFSRRYVLLFITALTVSVVAVAAAVGVVQSGLLSNSSNNDNRAAVPSRGSSKAEDSAAASNNTTEDTSTTTSDSKAPSQTGGNQTQITVTTAPAEVPVAPACTGFSCGDCSAPTATSTGEGGWSLQSLGYGYAAQACCAKAQCQWALATAYTCSGGATVFKVDCCTDAMQEDGPSLQSAPVLCTGTSYLSLGIGSMSPFRAEVRQLHTEPLQLLLSQFRQLQSEPAAALLWCDVAVISSQKRFDTASALQHCNIVEH
eukprot:14258-Heterococcus_DN1.PRE.5